MGVVLEGDVTRLLLHLLPSGSTSPDSKHGPVCRLSCECLCSVTCVTSEFEGVLKVRLRLVC